MLKGKRHRTAIEVGEARSALQMRRASEMLAIMQYSSEGSFESEKLESLEAQLLHAALIT